LLLAPFKSAGPKKVAAHIPRAKKVPIKTRLFVALALSIAIIEQLTNWQSK
jgi:flagellar biosynthesis protein FliR